MANDPNYISSKTEDKPHIFKPPKIIKPNLWKLEEDRQSKLNKCGHCHKIQALYRCGGCRQIRYCDRECQQKHWREHQKDCNWRSNSHDNEVIFG